MAGSASAKLAALKEKAAKQDQELENAFDAGPSSSQQEFSMKGVGTFRVSGEESDRLLRKKAPQATAQNSLGLDPRLLDTMKLVGIVLTAAGLAIFLLWLLFSGGSEQKARPSAAPGFQKPPLNASELQKAQPGNACPELSWLPQDCIGANRQKSKKVFDDCQEYFEDTGFSIELLKACGILAPDNP